MAKVAFIGLGVMGYPMAGHIARGGHDLTVYNRTASKADHWVAEFGGSSASTPKAAAEGCEFVFTCVGNDDDLRSVALGEDGAFHSMPRGSVSPITQTRADSAFSMHQYPEVRPARRTAF